MTGRSDGRPEADEHVVLVDALGRPTGTAPKATVHGSSTPLHLAFSCHVIDTAGRVLLARRARHKATWPGAWSNACCGHPRLGETLREAVGRRLADELGLTARRLGVAIPDFAYRAVMDDGTTEHELCPVLVAEVDGPPAPNHLEVGAVAWTTWAELQDRAAHRAASLSPWSVGQIAALAALGPDLRCWFDGRRNGASDATLDRPIVAGPVGTPAATGLDAALTRVVAPVEKRLRSFLAGRAEDLTRLAPDVADLTGAVERLVAPGRQAAPAGLRPLGPRRHRGSSTGGSSTGGSSTGGSSTGIVDAAAAVELLHTFALIHDDVMDRSEVRRGGPATHRELARARPGAGDGPAAEWYGTSAAVLAGDLAYLWADELFDEAVGDDPAGRRARRVFHTLRAEVIAGQYLDLRLSAETQPTEDAARRVALLKSARYTVTRPLQLGAALGGGPAELDTVLGAYGDAVGLAFQLRDDVLGLFGEPADTGKGCLDDLREGKRTLLVVRALGLADDAQRRVITAALGDPALDAEGAARCREAVASTGALASIEALLADLRHTAVAAIDGLAAPTREALGTLADFAAYRSA